MVSKLAMSWYTSQFGENILKLVTQLRTMSLLNRVATPLSYLNSKSATKQWGNGIGP